MATAEALGAELFQEKVGFRWTTSSSGPDRSSRLTFRTLDEVGAEAYAYVLGQVAHGLDREANWYADQTGDTNWGRVMMGYAAPEDGDSWVLAYDQDRIVGQIAVSAFDPDIADGTIVWIGVVPNARGHGYGAELLAAVPRLCAARGFRSMLNDTDILNRPMQHAFLSAGHVADPVWHRWQFRFGD